MTISVAKNKINSIDSAVMILMIIIQHTLNKDTNIFSDTFVPTNTTATTVTKSKTNIKKNGRLSSTYECN